MRLPWQYQLILSRRPPLNFSPAPPNSKSQSTHLHPSPSQHFLLSRRLPPKIPAAAHSKISSPTPTQPTPATAALSNPISLPPPHPHILSKPSSAALSIQPLLPPSTSKPSSATTIFAAAASIPRSVAAALIQTPSAITAALSIHLWDATLSSTLPPSIHQHQPSSILKADLSQQQPPVVPHFSSNQLHIFQQQDMSMDLTRVRSILSGDPEDLAGRKVAVGGWVKTGREQGKGTFAFLELNDGSCIGNLQVIVDVSVHALAPLVATGTSVVLEGELKKPPVGAKQKLEMRADRVLHVGPVDPARYPIPKTKLTLEFLRDFVHLRSRTNTISAVARIRDELAYATHTFFRNHGFRYIHTPIITTSDCEGAGEMFQVTTMFSDAEKIEKDLKENPPPSESDIEAAKNFVKEKGNAVALLKSNKAGKEEISAAVVDLNKAKENLSRLEERFKLKPGIPFKDGKVDCSTDFFGRQAFLTVSGQLQVETYACALGSVYTFGPTFRAEHSHTSRHLAEFWMVEPEIAFANLEDDMNCAENYVRFLCQWLLDHCLEDMEFMKKNYDSTAIDRLKLVSSTPFERISYTKAVKLLASITDKKFENKVEWGIDLASEHERYLTEVIFKKPVIVYNYPKGIKAFYMRLNDDKNTVAAMDVLVPKVGELIGGSQREERLEVLQKRIIESGLPLEPYEWYLDLRRFGTVKHSGFGLGFERMLLFATGIDNIRDVMPFPRYPGRADL